MLAARGSDNKVCILADGKPERFISRRVAGVEADDDLETCF